MSWNKIQIQQSNGEFVDAQAPEIISVSRSTDIPAFYSDWFMDRQKEGYVKWKNPFNGVPLYVSFRDARLFIFWSKNPKPMLKHFDPLILTDEIGVERLLRKVERIGNQLKDYTDKFVFSFADIKVYKKVQNNLRKNSIAYQEFNERTMTEFTEGLHKLNENWKFELATCAEKIPLEK
ncbi:MAG: DUF1848 domain-containing protein [Tannerella sp.]|jgi:hypothetical protein|nr:DUF1848 domain-containing protein [Tannerella sp.]